MSLGAIDSSERSGELEVPDPHAGEWDSEMGTMRKTWLFFLLQWTCPSVYFGGLVNVLLLQSEQAEQDVKRRINLWL